MPTQKSKPASIEDEIDEAGAIEKEIAPFEKKIKRLETLRKNIRALAPANASQVEGKKFVAELGEPASKTTVNYREIVKRIGAVRFAKFATATLKALQKHVSAGHLAQCVTTAQTGPRSLRIVEKGSPVE